MVQARRSRSPRSPSSPRSLRKRRRRPARWRSTLRLARRSSRRCSAMAASPTATGANPYWIRASGGMVLGGVPPDDLAHRIATAKAEAVEASRDGRRCGEGRGAVHDIGQGSRGVDRPLLAAEAGDHPRSTRDRPEIARDCAWIGLCRRREQGSFIPPLNGRDPFSQSLVTAAGAASRRSARTR